MSKRRKDWPALITQFECSGLTHSRFCERHSLNFHSFRYWLYKIRRQSAQETSEPLELLPVRVTGSSVFSGPAVSLRYGLSELAFADLPDPRYLSELLASLNSEAAL